jgi:hypothetical protein
MIFLGVKRGQRVRLRTSSPSVSRLSYRCWVLNISKPYGPPMPVTGPGFYPLDSRRLKCQTCSFTLILNTPNVSRIRICFDIFVTVDRVKSATVLCYSTCCHVSYAENTEDSGSRTNGLKLNSVAWVRERTVSTERPPLIGEVSVNFCG